MKNGCSLFYYQFYLTRLKYSNTMKSLDLNSHTRMIIIRQKKIILCSILCPGYISSSIRRTEDL